MSVISRFAPRLYRVKAFLGFLGPDNDVALVERLDEQVSREGVDPQRDAVVVRRIAEDVVRG